MVATACEQQSLDGPLVEKLHCVLSLHVFCLVTLCLWQVLSDVRSLTACLAEDSAVDLWGKVGTAHLASLIAAAAHT